ncbi:hypothetical protein QBC34DRAFT_363639 [Podospora aff. communis PSN243]|uniref:Uncharacterized protein n=1 Tax=Podospora aff. communis PSN243 TaxID=3040156 RepID=A0AAV9G219_9PEZI|nr:hypothetical protein QBC34DRAFT_363639 [Podospora aff. communis PSN243]
MEAFIFAFLILLLPSALGDSFLDQCKTRIEGILNGTETYGAVTNWTIDELGYIYHGPVGGINPSFSRENLLVVTKDGCKALCGTDINWYWITDISLTLGIVSNWVIPIIALLAVLPYEASQHGAKDGKRRWARHLTAVATTLGHLCNWLGSPQTVLTAILFNIYQMKMCLCAARPLPMRLSVKRPSRGSYRAITGQGKETSRAGRLLRMDAFYLLSCVGQFKPPEDTTTFLEGLSYGLLKPLLATTEDETSKPRDRTAQGEKWTTNILDAIAKQMRYSRRRGVWATFISILLFFIAYAVSVTLAFSNDLGDRTTTHSLAYGILISWLPLLVLFAIVDRNPNCADRTRTLLNRWMWNARAINDWETDVATRRPPKWWSPDNRPQNTPPEGCDATPTNFIGQGREIGYNGLAYAVLSAIEETSEDEDERAEIITNKAEDLLSKHTRCPPRSWWIIAVVTELIILIEVGMAVMMSSTVPTVGVGCRSGLYIAYGFFSSLVWFLHLFPWFRRQDKLANFIGHVLCLLATLCLLVITFASFSGVLKNCICRAGLSGYLDFEGPEIYKNRDIFIVGKFWSVAAITGAVPVVLCFILAILLFGRLQPLWQEEVVKEKASDVSVELTSITRGANKRANKRADMSWLI